MVLFISSMTQIIIIEKDGTNKYCVIKEMSDLYKKCGFRKSEGFSQINSWKKSCNNEMFEFSISLFLGGGVI